MPWVSGLPLLVVGAACEIGGVWAPAAAVVVVVGDLVSESGVMVDVEEAREKVLASGARCVSFSSTLRQPCHMPAMPIYALGVCVHLLLVSFHDILTSISPWFRSCYMA